MAQQDTWREATITPHHSGFGAWQCEHAGPAGDHTEILIAMGEIGAVTLLADGAALPDGAEDIRGRIYGEPDEIYVIESYDDGSIIYCGLTRRD